jgi:hypothetical protein
LAIAGLEAGLEVVLEESVEPIGLRILAVEVLALSPHVLDSERHSRHRKPPQTRGQILGFVIRGAGLTCVVVDEDIRESEI